MLKNDSTGGRKTGYDLISREDFTISLGLFYNEGRTTSEHIMRAQQGHRVHDVVLNTQHTNSWYVCRLPWGHWRPTATSDTDFSPLDLFWTWIWS